MHVKVKTNVTISNSRREYNRNYYLKNDLITVSTAVKTKDYENICDIADDMGISVAELLRQCLKKCTDEWFSVEEVSKQKTTRKGTKQ